MPVPALQPGRPSPPGEGLGPDGLLARGAAAHVAGDHTAAVQLLQRSFHALTADSPARDDDAAVTAACHLALVFAAHGEMSLFNGWRARARRLLEGAAPGPSGGPTSGDTADRDATTFPGRPAPPDAPLPSIGRGYLAVVDLHLALTTGDAAAIGPLSAVVLEAGTHHRDPDLTALGLVTQGRCVLYKGDVSGGLALLDEAMAIVLAGEAGPLAMGLAWCAAIEACQEIGASDRMVEWTRALQTWCAGRPQPGAFAGECALHTGQVLALQGSWAEADAEFAAAQERFLAHGQASAAGAAQRERGDVLRVRGRLDEAAAAYRCAAELGCDPQPGLALLSLARGEQSAAVAAVQRCLAETVLPAHRLSLLPAASEVLLSAGSTEEAALVLTELDALAETTGCAPVAAAAASAHARTELDRGDVSGALPYARKAVRLWSEIGCPFEAARARVLLARALRAAGDETSCRGELDAARQVFVRLGAAPSVTAVEELVGGGSSAPPSPGSLTAREVDVLRLVAAGASNHQVATRLCLSEKTVARHLSNIFTKLDVGSRTEAAAFAFEHGLMRD